MGFYHDRMGDRMVALVDFNKISKGYVGTVACPCDVDVSDKADQWWSTLRARGWPTS
jgi:hypothetical protein